MSSNPHYKIGFLLLLLGPAGCTLPAAAEAERPSLVSLGGESLAALPLVPRLSLAGSLPVAPEDLWLVRGTVSEKELGQLVHAAPTSDLTEKRVPLAVWPDADSLILAPVTVLEPSQDYTLVALSLGELAQVTTSPEPSPVWWRWQTAALAPGSWQVYCAAPPPWQAEMATAPEAGELAADVLGRAVLEPGGIEVEVLAGFAEMSGEGLSSGLGCVRFAVPEAPGVYLPPHQVAGRFFEPVPLLVEQGLPEPEPVPLHIVVQGSAAFLDLPEVSAEIVVEPVSDDQTSTRGRHLLVRTPTPSSLCLGLFEPGEYEVSVAILDARGRPSSYTLGFLVSEERGHPVLSEVLANPLGPEPESEWVEVVNVGRAPLDLGGWLLEDAEGTIELPSAVLPPGGVGLLVREDFAAGSSGDVVPAAAAIPIVVPELAQGGLANSGESLRLLTPRGEPVSEIPAQKAGAGQSLARRDLLAPDWVTSFGPHASPGASPGSANVVSSAED